MSLHKLSPLPTATKYDPTATAELLAEPGRRAAAKLMTKDEARKIAAGIAKLPELPSAREATGNGQGDWRTGLHRSSDRIGFATGRSPPG